MKKVLVIFVFILNSIFCINAQTIDYSVIPYIEVTGSSEMQVVPDELYFRIKVKEYQKDKQNKVFLSEIDNLLKQKLTEVGIGSENLSVTDLSSYYTKKFLQGYEAYGTKNYIIKIVDFSQVDTLFSCTTEKYISDIDFLNSSNSNITELRKQVKTDAIIAAQKKAEYLVEAIGDTLGRTLFIEELENTSYTRSYSGDYSNSVSYYNDYSNSNVLSNNVEIVDLSDQIENFKTITLKYEIKVRFEIK